MESVLNFQCFEKKMSVIAQVFLKLLTPRDVLVSMHNRACFWKAYWCKRINESQKLNAICRKELLSYWKFVLLKKVIFNQIILGLLDKQLSLVLIERIYNVLKKKWVRKKKRSEILGLLDNTLTAIARVFLKLLIERDLLV